MTGAVFDSEPAPAGHILERRTQLLEELHGCDVCIEMEPGNQEFRANREYVAGLLADVQEQIDNGELNETETARYLDEIADEDPFAGDDDQVAVKARRASLVSRVTDALTTDWAPVGDLVEAVQGRRLTESSAQHAAVRKVLARLAWPQQYRLDTPPSVEIRLGTASVFAAVRRIG